VRKRRKAQKLFWRQIFALILCKRRNRFSPPDFSIYSIFEEKNWFSRNFRRIRRVLLQQIKKMSVSICALRCSMLMLDQGDKSFHLKNNLFNFGSVFFILKVAQTFKLTYLSNKHVFLNSTCHGNRDFSLMAEILLSVQWLRIICLHNMGVCSRCK
jgi:hypothetical protein